jgi:exoribonuclease-2
VTFKLGLGIQEISPALSFAIDIGTDGDVLGFEVVTSWIRAQRLSYQEAEERIDQEPFHTLFERASLLRQRRRQNQAVMIDFPEVKVIFEDRLVHISPIQPFRSRVIVEEAMILTGMQAARFASERGICLAYSHQDPVEIKDRPETLSGMFALRRFLKRSRFQTMPGPHHGLGASAYSQVTSPLRRYLDLVAHQQLRAYLAGLPGLSSEQVRERIDLVESMLGSLRQAETASELHWTMVYLLQHPGWRGAGILVEKRGSSGTLILPDLSLEIRVHLRHDWPLDSTLPVVCTGVNLPNKEASFRVIEN